MALSYSDIIMAFGVAVAFVATIGPVYSVIQKMQGFVDPLTALLLGMVPGLLVVAIMLSIGVSSQRT